MWPTDPADLTRLQRRLAGLPHAPWTPDAGGLLFGGCWVCFPRGERGRGGAGDAAWSAAVLQQDGHTVARSVRSGGAPAGYTPGMLAMRVGALLADVVRSLPREPEVLLVDGTGRDHPRRAGLALHLGAVLDVPTVGVTHRPLVAEGDWPDDERGGASPLVLDGEVVAAWVRTRPGTRPLVAHPGWRTDVHTAVEVVRRTAAHRTPEPLRAARQVAREARTAAGR